MRREIADKFKDKVFLRRPHLQTSHPLACAAALAAIRVYEEDHLLENARRMGGGDEGELARRARAQASVGSRAAPVDRPVRPSSSWSATRRSKVPLRAVQRPLRRDWPRSGRFFREEGLYTFVRWNSFFTNPPLCITEAQLRDAFAIIDRGLEITDKQSSKKSEV